MPACADATAPAFARYVLQRAGLDPDAYRPRPLVRRMPACLRALGAASEAHAEELVRAGDAHCGRAVDALLIGVTEFFRDPDVFDSLAPAMSELVPPGRPLRAWSAGCATGAEIYSLAMLLHESGRLAASTLLGTDCRPGPLRVARDGVFDRSAMQHVDSHRRDRHFEALDAGLWRVRTALRCRAHFAVADVTRTIEPGPWDVVLWRNVSIYLDHALVERLTAALVDVLAAGGLLVLGKAERPPQGLPLRRIGRCIFRKTAHGC